MEKLELAPGFVEELRILYGVLKEPVTITLPGVWNVQVVSNPQFASQVFVNGKFVAYCGTGAYSALTVLARMLDTVKPTPRVNLRLKVRTMTSHPSNREIEAASWE